MRALKKPGKFNDVSKNKIHLYSNSMEVTILKFCLKRQFLHLLIIMSLFSGHSLYFEDGMEASSFEYIGEAVDYPSSKNSAQIRNLPLQDSGHLVFVETEVLSEQEFEEKVHLPSLSTSQLVYTKLSNRCNQLYAHINEARSNFNGIPLYDMYCSRRYHLS